TELTIGLSFYVAIFCDKELPHARTHLSSERKRNYRAHGDDRRDQYLPDDGVYHLSPAGHPVWKDVRVSNRHGFRRGHSRNVYFRCAGVGHYGTVCALSDRSGAGDGTELLFCFFGGAGGCRGWFSKRMAG